MTKTLSEQLCEIVGLPYKKKRPFRYPGIEEVLCKCTYLDFEQPENFVKLQELMVTQGMGYIVQLFDYPTTLRIEFAWDENQNFYIMGNSFKEVFLRFCLQICELEDGYIKQTIRDYDGWVWG